MSKEKTIPSEQKNLIEGLLGKVQNMSDEDFKKILNMGAGFHNYSFFNKLLIMAQGASQVAGFKAWQNKYKRKVKKDEKKRRKTTKSEKKNQRKKTGGNSSAPIYTNPMKNLPRPA